MSWIREPKKFRKLNGILTIAWIVAIPISYALGLLESVVYVSALSLYAIVTGHMSTWQAGNVEVRQEEDNTQQLVEEIKQTQQEEKQTRKLEKLDAE